MSRALPASVATYVLGPAELAEIDRQLLGLAAEHRSAAAPEFVVEARRLAFSTLPAGLARFLDRFRRTEFSAAVAIQGLGVDDAAIGLTPAHWRDEPRPGSTFREEAFFVLAASILGDLFSWESLQDGRLMHNVVPIRHQEDQQSGHGSLATLAWHTEDGFHPYRCDYLGLLSLRNDDHVPTTCAPIDAIHLSAGELRVLAEPRFVMRPDDEHLNQRARDGHDDDRTMRASWSSPPRTAVLFGDPSHPYLRIDPIFMAATPGDTDAADALSAIAGQLDAGLADVVLEPGTVFFVDNYRAVHGRAAFRASYDGRDRWLKKILVTRDLRKSRDARGATEAWVVRTGLPAHSSDGPAAVARHD